jgi:hypothetical protein
MSNPEREGSLDSFETLSRLQPGRDSDATTRWFARPSAGRGIAADGGHRRRPQLVAEVRDLSPDVRQGSACTGAAIDRPLQDRSGIILQRTGRRSHASSRNSPAEHPRELTERQVRTRRRPPAEPGSARAGNRRHHPVHPAGHDTARPRSPRRSQRKGPRAGSAFAGPGSAPAPVCAIRNCLAHQ